MSTASSTPAASGAATPRAGVKGSRPSKLVVILNLPSSVLSQWPSAPSSKKGSRSKHGLASTPTPAKFESPTPQDDASDAPQESTPQPSNESSMQPPSVNGVKRKGIPGPKPGSLKRTASTQDLNEDQPKPRGKPGPKSKKQKEEGEANGSNKGGAATVPHHKLGPKANTGAINAGLRALDRTGKPCRKWGRRGFQLKSFTGVAWSTHSWHSPKESKPDLSGDVKSETTGSSEAKAENSSSVVASEKSQSGGDAQAASTALDVASSPAPARTPPQVEVTAPS